jgi:hypothetical protein
MAKKRKAATAGRRKAAPKRKKARKPARRTAARKATKKAARKTARKPARKKARKPKQEGIAARFAHAVDAVLDTLTDAERLHAQTTHKKGFQELE